MRRKASKAASKWFCRACNKVAYGSAGRAEYAMGLAAQIGSEHVPIRTYPCPYGNGHHLSSKEART